MDCIHRRSGDQIGSILTKIFADSEDFMSRIGAVEFRRPFSKNPFERLSTVLSVLEKYLKRRYTSADERTYLDAEKMFFAWMRRSKNSLGST